MPTRRVTLRIEGFAVDGGHVALSVFLHQIQALSSLLTRADEMVSVGKKTARTHVVNLSHSSPASVTVEVRPGKKGIDSCDAIVAAIKEVPGIRIDSQVSDRSRLFLKAFRELASPVGRLIPRASIVVDENEIVLSAELKERISQILAREETAFGSTEGRLEAINIHDEANVFFIYPVVGATKVKCYFPADLKQQAISYVDKNVLVSGVTHYKVGDPYPFEIDVEELVRNPDDSELPSMMEIHGIAPSMADGMPAEEYVRKVRDGWR